MSDSAAVLSPPVKEGNYLATGETALVAAEAFAAVCVVRRPSIIDPADGPCEICAAHRSGHCDRCGLDGTQRKKARAAAEPFKERDPDKYHTLMAEADLLPDGLMCSVVSDSTKWAEGNGFQSVKPSHYHLAPVLGVAGREAHFDELCIECYRKDYSAVYGTEPPL